MLTKNIETMCSTITGGDGTCMEVCSCVVDSALVIAGVIAAVVVTVYLFAIAVVVGSIVVGLIRGDP